VATLTWDQVGERLFETGVSKGVLYKADGHGVAWNGLISVDNNQSDSTEPIYFDGVKFDDIVTQGDFTATITAYTYPDEFEPYEGSMEDQAGFFVLNQPPHRAFGLSYRTNVGDDIIGIEKGYKIHLLYNLIVVPSQKSYQTLGDSIEPVEFEWTISAIPEEIEGYRPTAHVVIDSTRIDPYLLADLEEILYGATSSDELTITDHGDGTWTAYSPVEDVITLTGDGEFEIESSTAVYLDPDTYTISSSANDAYLPSLKALASFIRSWNRLVITDNGDGTWTASSPIDGVITMINPTTFQIETDTATYLDADTYTITSSDKNEGDIWLPR
jgi:hypothetical protein